MSKGITKIVRTNLGYNSEHEINIAIRKQILDLFFNSNNFLNNILIVYDKNFTIIMKGNDFYFLNKFRTILNFRAGNDTIEICSSAVSQTIAMIENNLDILYFRHLNKLDANTPEKQNYEYRQLKRKLNAKIAKRIKFALNQTQKK